MVNTAGRPRAFSESEVLDRAVSVFWERGFRGTTTRDLESALGISQSSLYNAFGSKDRLHTRALDRYQEQACRAAIEPLEAAEDGLDSLDRFIDVLAAWVSSPQRGGCMIINLMVEDAGASPDVAARSSAYRGRVRAALRGAMGRGVDRGEISAESVEVRTDLLFAAVFAINVAARAAVSPEELDALVRATHYLVDSWRQ